MFYSPLVKKASLLAFEAHKNDYDKGGYPYVMHPFYLGHFRWKTRMPFAWHYCTT